MKDLIMVTCVPLQLESLGEAKVSLQKLCLLQSVLVRQLVTVCESAGGHIPPLFTAVADKLDEMKANIAAELADLVRILLLLQLLLLLLLSCVLVRMWPLLLLPLPPLA